MRLYRVHLYNTFNSSEGFAWFSSRREAEHRMAEYRRETDPEWEPEPRMEVYDFQPTKAGILGLLRRVATHEENG
jgi:hypothetical protein